MTDPHRSIATTTTDLVVVEEPTTAPRVSSLTEVVLGCVSCLSTRKSKTSGRDAG